MSEITAGYYWARFEGVGCGWEPVHVLANVYSSPLMERFGDAEPETLTGWEFGPRLEPPEEKSEDSP